jgi:hypothetical protein
VTKLEIQESSAAQARPALPDEEEAGAGEGEEEAGAGEGEAEALELEDGTEGGDWALHRALTGDRLTAAIWW